MKGCIEKNFYVGQKLQLSLHKTDKRIFSDTQNHLGFWGFNQFSSCVCFGLKKSINKLCIFTAFYVLFILCAYMKKALLWISPRQISQIAQSESKPPDTWSDCCVQPVSYVAIPRIFIIIYSLKIYSLKVY